MSVDLEAIKTRSAAHDIPGDHPEAYRWPVLLRQSANDVPALVAEIEALRAELAKVRTGVATIAWHPFDGARAYGFAEAHGLPVVAHVYRTGDDVFGWDVFTLGVTDLAADWVAGGDADSVDEGQRWCALALADWSREQVAGEAAARAVTDRWAAGFGEVPR